MIFTLELRFRNCPACKQKVVFQWDRCGNCSAPFSAESNKMIRQVHQQTRQRIQRLWDGGGTDPNQILFSKFYPYGDAYHHILGIPLYTLEEALIVQNLMYRGHPRTNKTWPPEWIASFCLAEQEETSSPMHLRSWQPLLWDEEQQVYLVGPDEGPRTIQWTPWE